MKTQKLQQGELLDLLNNKLGVPMKYGTLRNYEKQKLILPPVRGSGYRGKWSEYEPITLAEAATAWRLIHGKYVGDAEMTKIFSGKLPSLNATAVALARAMFMEKMKESGLMTEEAIRKTNWEDLQELKNYDKGFLNDRTGYQYLVRFIEYIWRQELLEALCQCERIKFG